MKHSRRDFLTALGTAGIALPVGANAAVNWMGKTRVMQGPMLGWAGTDRAAVWVRSGGPHELQLETLSADGRAQRGPKTLARAADDYCVVLESARLEPGSRYRYRILIDDAPDAYFKDEAPAYLRTAPSGAASFSIAFGSCAKWQDDPVQPIWTAVDRSAPDLFFWLGDNVYIDSKHENVMVEEYRRQRDVTTLQPVLRNVPQLAVWDDHDFGLNDHDRRNPVKETALRVFKQYWANPAYGAAGNPGVYFRYPYSDVDFFFLDVRYHRDPNEDPDGGGKTMLGKVQLEWLKNGLAESAATFKVLVSGSGWSKAKGPTGDAWSSHLDERNALFEFVRREGIGGVLLISGDTHVGELNCIPWSEQGGYDFYELVSSPLAQKTESGSWLERRPEIRLRQVYFVSVNFGVLDFDFEGDEPAVSMSLRGPEGHSVIRPVTLRASDLRNGRATWRANIDELSLERHESMLSGGPYYIPLE